MREDAASKMEAAKKEAEAEQEKALRGVQEEIAALRENAAQKESQAVEAVIANLY